MNDPAIRFEAMTIGSLLDRTFRLYAGNLALMLGIVAVSNVPVYLLQMGLLVAVPYCEPATGRLLAGLTPLLVLILIGLGAYPLTVGAGTYAISERYLGREVGIGTAYAHAWKRWGALLNAQFTLGLRIFGGCLLLLVPGIILACAYAVAIPAVMLEGTNAITGIHRSRDLSKGLRRKVFNVGIMLVALNLVVVIASSIFVRLALDTPSVAGALAEIVAQNLVTMAFTPLGVIANILLYYDFRIRKEGFDLEMLSQAMATESEPSAAAPGV